MVPAVGGSLGRPRFSSYEESSSSDGWNGWLYPLLFIVLPVIACLMIMALIICNLIEYYRKKRRLAQYEHSYYADCPDATAERKCPDIYEQMDHTDMPQNRFNDYQYTHNTLFAHQNGIKPNIPISGWLTAQKPI